MQKFRILLLKTRRPPRLWIQKKVKNTEVIVIQEEQSWKGQYDKIVRHEAEKADMIVIGNNRGQGRREATNIPEKAKPRTIVVFNFSPDQDDKFDYEKMGFTQFGTRSGLKSRIRKTVNAKIG